MLQKWFKVLSMTVLVFLVLAACGGSESAAPEPTETPVSEPTATPEPEATVEPSVEMAEGSTESSSEEQAEESVNDVRTYVIVPEGSRASYIVDEEFFGGALDRLGIEPGLVDTIGATQEVAGEMQLDFSNLPAPVVFSQFTVNLQSLTSDQSRRDKRIRETSLESNIYPLAEFTITSLDNTPAVFNEGEEVTFKANGDITIRDITQPTTFDVTAKLEGDTITGVTTANLKMTDFGFNPPSFANMFSVEDAFVVEVEFTFKEQ